MVYLELRGTGCSYFCDSMAIARHVLMYKRLLQRQNPIGSMGRALETTMWGTTSGCNSDSSIHLVGPDHTAVRRRQGGTGHLDLTLEVLLPISGRQSPEAIFMPIKIQLRKGFGQTIQ
jgi:hypothetical protein